MTPDKETSIALYKCLLKIRLAEQRIISIYPSDKIQSPVHLSIGQEAVSAGVCKALTDGDHIYGTYRGHGLYIAVGGSLKKLFAELYGKDTGCDRGKGGSMHLVAPEAGLMSCSAIVASTIPVATGDALASQIQGGKRVVVSVFGDGAVDEGVFFESINFAVLKNLPIIYVLENNRYSIHSRIADRHKNTELFRLGEGLGLKGKKFDGNDVFTVYSSMRLAVENARNGGGPVLHEYTTLRWKEHVGIMDDFQEGYRHTGEREESVKNDPVQRAKTVLAEKFGVGPNDFAGIEKEIIKEIDDAVDFADKSPFPKEEQLLENVYSGKTA